MSLQELTSRIEDRSAKIGVVGVGYVGLPVCCELARVGFRVTAVDVNAERVRSIADGRSPIEGDEPGLPELLAEVHETGRLVATTDYRSLEDADVVILCVDTPVDQDHRPRYTALSSACASLGSVMQDGVLVIVESTVAPGTAEGVVLPLLEEASGRKIGYGFYLGVCPERVMPGRLLSNLRSMSRVCGGHTSETARAMTALYRQIVHADLDISDMVTAELVKTAENAYRDVQIAFANEVALICEANGADAYKVRELVNKSPYRQMHVPGAGVGGHCIPKDPWLLAHAAGEHLQPCLISAARAVNDGMPLHVADLTKGALAACGVALAHARVAVLGYAYLENSGDTRNSPSQALERHLRELGAEVIIHDPWVNAYQGNILERIAGCDATVLMVRHREYEDLNLEQVRALLRTPVLIDGRGMFDPAVAQAAGLEYHGVGRGWSRT